MGQKLFNANCDMFSLGAVFHFLMMGQQLFKGENPQDILEKNKKLEVKL